MIEKWGLDQPVHIRYVRWLWGVIRLEFGRSLYTNRPVLPTVISHLANSLLPGALAVIGGALVAIPMGVISAVKPYSKIDGLWRIAALFGLSMPVFWSGMLVQIFFSVRLGSRASRVWRALCSPLIDSDRSISPWPLRSSSEGPWTKVLQGARVGVAHTHSANWSVRSPALAHAWPRPRYGGNIHAFFLPTSVTTRFTSSSSPQCPDNSCAQANPCPK